LLLDRKFLPVAATCGPTRLSGLCLVVSLDLAEPGVMSVLNDVQVVVHAAARVHVTSETAADALAMYRKINVDGTLSLARRAAKSGVARFIFISSIKVNGESTVIGNSFQADNSAAPVDPYGVSKYEAEEGLKQLSRESGMEVVIIRPPLVYSPGVKANFLSMMRWLDKGVPLSLGVINNQRSLVANGNLVDLIVTCLKHPAVANQIFLMNDGEDLSTSQLLRSLAQALGRKSRLVPVPQWLLSLRTSLVGKQAAAKRICGSLQVNIDKNRDVLGWIPPISVGRAMRRTAGYYLDKQTK